MRGLIRRPAYAAPHDPAPSKIGYRYQRLLLTPGFRATMRIGVPLALIAIILGTHFAKPENRAAFAAQIDYVKQQFQDRPQFMVKAMTITGADQATMVSVIALLPSDYPVSSFDIDLEQTRRAIEALDPVKSASVRVGAAGTLEVRLTPRVPAALWRDGAILRMIDNDGVTSGAVASRSARLDLPLIAGDGAEQHIEEALALYASAGPLRPRVRGLVRMGERRWDIVLDREQRILLPGDGAIAALDRVVALNAAQDMLDRDVTVVDMRNANRPTLRMNEEAVAAMRRVNDNVSINGAGN